MVGPGGCGKTRLAVETAAALDPAPPDGRWLVELAPWSDPDDLPQAVLGSISLRASSLLESGSSDADPLARLVDGLTGRQALLVVDNCEHLVEATARVVEHLLTRCPGLRVLATSREPLGVYGEALLPLSPLTRPDRGMTAEQALQRPSVRLFADRAASVAPRFRVEDGAVGAVVEICRRLDGLPLALELAAARLRTLPVQVVADRIDDRFRLLTGGSRTAVPRHQTLRAVVTWSWELLDPVERDLVERLAVFAGSADLAAVTAVAGSTAGTAEEQSDQERAADLLDLLGALVDKSLLVMQPGEHGPRWRMLETIREYGLERLTERRVVDQVRAVHAGHYLELAEQAEPRLRRSEQVEWLARLSADRDNLHAAIRFAADAGDVTTAVRLGAALAWYWTVLGAHADALTWLTVVFDVRPGQGRVEDAPAQAWTVAGAVHALSLAAAGRVEDALATADRIRERMAQLDPLTGHPLLTLVEPGLLLMADDGVKARAAMDRSLAHPDPWARAVLQLMRSISSENDGDVAEMRVALPEALAGFRQVGDRWGMSAALSMTGQVHSLDGDDAGAIAAFEEAMRLMGELDAMDDVAYVLVRLSGLRTRAGDLAGAERDARRALALAEQRGSASAAAGAHVALAALDRCRGDRASALERAERGAALIAGVLGAPPQIAAITLSMLGVLEAERGRFDAAAQRLAQAMERARAGRDMPVTAIVSTAMAVLAAEQGDHRQAAELIGAGDVARGAPEAGDPDLAEILGRARAALGAEAVEQARAGGAALTREQALDRLAAGVQVLRR